jgi:hypothetical protein
VASCSRGRVSKAHAASALSRAQGATPSRTRSSAAAASTQGPPRSACNTKKVSSRESASACSAARAPASGTRARQPRTPATHRQHGRPRLIRVHGGRRLGRCHLRQRSAGERSAAQMPASRAVSISSVQREWTARSCGRAPPRRLPEPRPAWRQNGDNVGRRKEKEGKRRRERRGERKSLTVSPRDAARHGAHFASARRDLMADWHGMAPETRAERSAQRGAARNNLFTCPSSRTCPSAP